MGIFSKTPRSGGDGTDRDDRAEAHRETGPGAPIPGAHDDEGVAQAASNIEHLSPFALKMQEKLRQLDGLKTRIGGLSRTFEQMNALATESQHSIALLADYVESSRGHVETEIRLKSENAKLSTDLLDRAHQVKTLTTQLEEAQAEVHSLRKRSTETRTALETARNDIITIRDNNKKVNDEYRAQSARLVEANAQIAELSSDIADLQAKYDALETHAESLKSALDSMTRREKELQQNLSESAALLDDEYKKTKRQASELEVLKREVAEFRTENIDLKSHLDVARQELDYSKNRLEEEQRKHDNQVFALNAEIENLSSQRRIGAQSLQEVTRENTSIKERNRDLIKRMQEIEHLLDGAQKNHEHDRNELLSANAKLRELNLRYNSVLTDLNHERAQNKKYSENIEALVDENKKFQTYRIKYDTANDQISQLKAVIANYQKAMAQEGLFVPPDADAALAAASAKAPEGDDEDNGDRDDGRIVKLRD